MDDSMAYSGGALANPELPGWKWLIATVSAVLTAALFLVTGLYKITDAPGFAARLVQLRVPQEFSLILSLGLGIVETFAAVLVLVPRFRRWGSWLTSALLVVFMIYVGVNYNVLRGEECSCFPWVKRAVGPAFFVGDALMLAMAVLAGVWAKRPESKRSAILVLAAVTVFGLVSYGVAENRNTGLKAPASITVDGKPYSLEEGKIMIFFFDPECSHCLDAGKQLATLNWGDTKLVGVPVVNPQFGQSFLQATGMNAVLSTDVVLLRKTFKFGDAPYGVVLEDGREKASLLQFENGEPEATLKKLGVAQ
jgi:uncharacterized membrane protein YphA (DoxX/SURF4 family)